MEHTTIFVMMGDELIGKAIDLREVSEMINNYISESMDEEQDIKKRITLINAVDEVELSPDVLKYTPGKVTCEEWEENEETETIFIINDGQYRGKRFDYMLDVQDFLIDKIERGELTAEEASEIEILKQPVLSGGIEFDQEDGNWAISYDEVDSDERERLELFGTKYVRAKELENALWAKKDLEEKIQKEIDRRIEELVKEQEVVSLKQPLEDLSTEYLQELSIKLMNRASDLMAERARRVEAKAIELGVIEQRPEETDGQFIERLIEED